MMSGQLSPEAAESIIRSFYMDDLLGSYKDTETAKRVREELARVMPKGGLNSSSGSRLTQRSLRTQRRRRRTRTSMARKTQPRWTKSWESGAPSSGMFSASG